MGRGTNSHPAAAELRTGSPVDVVRDVIRRIDAAGYDHDVVHVLRVEMTREVAEAVLRGDRRAREAALITQDDIGWSMGWTLSFNAADVPAMFEGFDDDDDVERGSSRREDLCRDLCAAVATLDAPTARSLCEAALPYLR